MSGELKHNLNIYMYSFDEILGLFDLDPIITVEDLKRAKKKVLMLHPDKSKLSSDYFLFYKKAFDIVLSYYENNNKQHKPVPKEEIPYDVSNINNFNKSTDKHISSIINDIKPQVFQEQFNQLFEKNMIPKNNKEKNKWFYEEEPIYSMDAHVSKSNMNQQMENIKQQNQNIVKYNGVQSLYSGNGGGKGTSYYDEDEDSGDYMTSDPFSKLKFDDLRKVHKDQTIFAVKENDFNHMKKYASVEQMNRDRGQQDLKPIDKTQAEQMLSHQQRIQKETYSQKNHQDILKTQQYAEKNKTILSAFLHLKN